MKKDTLVVVRQGHPFHHERIGFFQFFGGPTGDCAIVSETIPGRKPQKLFVVDREDLQEVAVVQAALKLVKH